MVKWVQDRVRGFSKRPHFEALEIDRECETLTEAFLLKKYGKVEYPLSTDDLTSMIEAHVDHLDIYADLSEDGHDVEGVTRFYVGKKPVIEIAETLSAAETRENRLRTTLAHELGHVRLHDPIIQAAFGSGDLFHATDFQVVLKRDAAAPEAASSDWMEWQAKYSSGAYLMPRKAVHAFMRPLWEADAKMPPVLIGDWTAESMVMEMVKRFQVSREAARVRLLSLEILTRQKRPPDLFS